jgi:hypothetical protein
MRFRGGETKEQGRETESSSFYISNILTSPLNKKKKILHSVFYKHTHTPRCPSTTPQTVGHLQFALYDSWDRKCPDYLWVSRELATIVYGVST